MYHYLPNKTMLTSYWLARKKWKVHEWASKYATSYEARCILCKYYPSVNYYSPVKLRLVPVNGLLFPVWYFDETKE